MEPLSVTGDRSDVPPFESLLFNEEFQRLIGPQAAPAGNASSFAAILELGPTQAMELLHWPEHPDSRPYVHSVDDGDVLFAPPSSANAGYGARCVAYAGEKSSTPSSQEVKQEAAACSASKSSSWTHPVVSDTALESKGPSSTKRKEREQKGKGSAKKKKKNESSQDAQALPYVHVRARRGQATDSHSLAERARREKINARMKLLQELVPGCSKISGTALVLDEIINHVQSLQRQVELLSMKLAAVNPHIDFNLDSIFAPEDVSLLDGNSPVPMMWPGIQFCGSGEHYQQQRHFPSFQHSVWVKEEGSSFAMPEVSHSTSNRSANAVPLGSHQPRMEM